MKKTKPFVIIRRSGFYVNTILNNKRVISAWKRNNVPLADPDAEPDKNGIRPSRTINQSIKANCITFIPASALQVRSAKCYIPEYRNKYGIIQ